MEIKRIRWTQSFDNYFKILLISFNIIMEKKICRVVKILEMWNTALQEPHLNLFT